MRAWNFYSNEDWLLEKVDDPKPAADEVVVKIKVVQPSITEVVARELGDTPMTARIRQLLSQRSPRRLFGHEFSGEVVSTGEQVSHLVLGDRVACLRSSFPCGACRCCRRGDSDRCQSRRSIGFDSPGCFAEYSSIAESCLAKLPIEVDDHEGATLQPLGYCLTTLQCAKVQPTHTLVILGQGVLGLGILQIARSQGVKQLITTDTRLSNVELSKKLGADRALHTGFVDIGEAIEEMTKGRGADIVIDAAGGSTSYGLSGWNTFRQAVELVCEGGTVAVAALMEGPIPTDVSILSSRGLRIVWPGDLLQPSEKQLLGLLQKRQLITQPTIKKIVHGLEQVPEAFRITADKNRYETMNPCQVVA